MTGFDPGEGWRQIAEKDIRLGDAVISYASEYGADPTWWVRVPPVPPLPTEPHTVIRATWAKGARKGAQDILINELGGWCDLEGTIYDRKTAAESITDFEVLAEPRAGAVRRAEESARRLTAKAVLDRVRASTTAKRSELDAIARDFGIDPDE